MDGMLAAVPVLLASAEGGFDWLQWTARILNFLILAGVLVYFALPMAMKMLKDRQSEITSQLKKAEEDLAEARKRKAEAEQTLAKLAEEAAVIKENAVKDAEEERERILEQARQNADRILELAEQRIDSAGREARQDLRRYTAQLSAELAEEILRKEIGPEDLEQMFEEGLKNLEGEA
jgi:F-type H+-transporting ATPase subunit b